MRASIVREFGTPPTLEAEMLEPSSTGDDDVVVAIDAAAVSHLDITIASGAFPLRPPLPYSPGTDAAGHVIEGKSFELGARVFIRGAGVGVTRSGCWAERVVVPAAAVHPLPQDVDSVLGATFFVPCATAQAAVRDVASVAAGERVAVRGAAGAVGSVAAQLAIVAGAEEVIGIVRNDESTGHLPSGVRPVVAPTSAQLAALHGENIDVLIDTVGGDGLPALIEAMRPGGRIVLVGYVAGATVTFELPRLLAQDIYVLPVNMIRHQDRYFKEATELLHRLAQGELRLETTVFSLESLNEAIAALAVGGPPGRIAVVVGT